MERNKLKAKRRLVRRRGARHTIEGTPERPRLAVYRSLKHIYAQVIDDLDGRTIASASTMDKDAGVGREKGGNQDAAKDVGSRIAAKAKSAGVSKVVFDRGGFRYHGRVAALADAAREAGLSF